MHKVQGNIAEAKALLHFTTIGCMVSKPLFENCPYDLVVEFPDGLKRVQVKSTEYFEGSSYRVELRTKGGSSYRESKRVTAIGCDLVFVSTPEACYIIPVEALDGQTRICLGKRCDQYKV